MRIHRGASLIELLVVLAIIGGMMSLLFPALMSARELANEMVCEIDRVVRPSANHIVEAKERKETQDDDIGGE